MDSHQFNEKWEKLIRATIKAKVLELVLAGHTNAEIARLRGRTEGTIRKQISKIYEDFGIKSEFPGDQSQRDKLKALFRKHKPEWVSDCPSAVTNEVSNEQEHLNQDNIPHPSSTRAVEGDENLMSLATRLLQKLGFDQKFKVTKVSGYIGYRFKNPEEVTYPYRLILSQKQEGLCISIPQYILEPYLLTLKYWRDEDEFDIEEVIAGRFFVLPSKEDIFLESLHPNYWSIREFVGKIVGTFYLNELKKLYYYDERYGSCSYYRACSSISVDEFNPNTLSASNSYLVLREDKRFSYTLQICISSREVLQEFIDHFGKILILDNGIPDADAPDIPF
jgi:DNA-binding CsgD family transcriptional regulator